MEWDSLEVRKTFAASCFGSLEVEIEVVEVGVGVDDTALQLDWVELLSVDARVPLKHPAWIPSEILQTVVDCHELKYTIYPLFDPGAFGLSWSIKSTLMTALFTPSTRGILLA